MYDFHGSSFCRPHNITLLCSIQPFIYSHHDCACGPHGVPCSFEPGRSEVLHHMTADLSKAARLVQLRMNSNFICSVTSRRHGDRQTVWTHIFKSPDRLTSCSGGETESHRKCLKWFHHSLHSNAAQYTGRTSVGDQSHVCVLKGNSTNFTHKSVFICLGEYNCIC